MTVSVTTPGKMETMECAHAVHLQPGVVLSPVNRPARASRQPRTAADRRSVALAVVRGCSELAERTLLDLPDALGAESDPLADITQRLLGAVEAVAGAEDHPLAVVEA